MTRLPALLRSRRAEMGMTQSELGRVSGVSLPTIQNLERGAGNPSLSTLESLLEALGLEVGVDTVAADWDALSALGLPLSASRASRLAPTEDLLVRHARLAASELAQGSPCSDGSERRHEALQALLLAVRSQFPTLFARAFARSEAVARILDRPVTGRVVKLKRIALASISRYL